MLCFSISQASFTERFLLFFVLGCTGEKETHNLFPKNQTCKRRRWCHNPSSYPRDPRNQKKRICLPFGSMHLSFGSPRYLWNRFSPLFAGGQNATKRSVRTQKWFMITHKTGAAPGLQRWAPPLATVIFFSREMRHQSTPGCVVRCGRVGNWKQHKTQI
jgi:hypothetical protein